jgi:16S rRNA (cytosine1402-N4)-methyltransferase
MNYDFPSMTRYTHTPVLLHECIEGLSLEPGQTIIDGTVGLGGHSEEILQKILPGGHLIAIDQDETHLVLAKQRLHAYRSHISFVNRNFFHLQEICESLNISSVSGILLDLGVASPHFDDASRGFSFREDFPLDMRMDRSSPYTAQTLINTASYNDLVRIFFQYGEEPLSRKIAHAICTARDIQPINTTQELTNILESVLFVKNKNKQIFQRIFQALRIAVNNELDILQDVLKSCGNLLSTGGRLAVISYHSLEDRIVKSYLKDQARHCICPKEFPRCMCTGQPRFILMNKKPIVPSDSEIEKNPRARSAKLRIAQKNT